MNLNWMKTSQTRLSTSLVECVLRAAFCVLFCKHLNTKMLKNYTNRRFYCCMFA